MGFGYVGLPPALTFSERDFNVIRFDIDKSKIKIIQSGEIYIRHISAQNIKD